MNLIDRLRRPRCASDVEHSIVYRHEQEFCAWPFVGGLWETRDGSSVVVFTPLSMSITVKANSIHHDNLSARQNGAVVSLRSNDRGKTWDVSTWQELFDIPKLKQGIWR